MTDNETKREYEELVRRVKEELPNIVLPSMGMLNDVGKVDIDGKNYIINKSIKEE